MNIRKLYLNIWIRNSVLYLLLLAAHLPQSMHDNDVNENILFLILNDAVTLLIAFVMFISHNVFLYERFFKEKKYKQYAIGFILIWLIYSMVNLYTRYGLASGGIAITLIGTVFVFVFGLGFYFIQKNIIEKHLFFSQELYIKEEEIRYLKSQLNPHFLFNALNNLYGVALSAPTETAGKILELSDLLRYQIETSQKEFTLLREEIEYLQNYFSYERNRNANLEIAFRQNGEPGDIAIAPLLFMPFIENAIKFSAETDKPLIAIDLTISKKNIVFSVINNYDEKGKKLVGTHTGIINTQKRLSLVYENQHELIIKNENGIYEVHLSLQL